MKQMFTDAQPLPTADCLPEPGSAEYAWWLSERGLLNIASGEDAQVVRVEQNVAQSSAAPASSVACPRERGQAACGGCKCA